MNLKEIYESKKDVCETLIPDKWKKSIQTYMFGQTCLLQDNGKLKYYSHDFAGWYNENKLVIERDINIDKIVNN